MTFYTSNTLNPQKVSLQKRRDLRIQLTKFMEKVNENV